MLAATTAQAQWPTSTSPFVPIDHWSYGVIRRLDAAGLLPPGSDAARRSIPQEEIAGLLAFAMQADTSGVTGAYLQRFREDFAAPRARGVSRLDGSILPSYYKSENQVLAGVGYEIDWSGARPIDDQSDGVIFARTALGARNLAAALGIEDDRIAELQIVASAGAIGGWGGRRAFGYSVARGGGVVLDRGQFDAGGVFLTRPVSLPIVGAIRFETNVSEVQNFLAFDDSLREVEPWFWNARGTIEPHARFRIGVNRAMIFGGEGNLPVTASRVFKNLLGMYTADGENSFANQVASFDFRYRAPTGSIPISFYLEIGADDGAGSVWDVPGVIAGFEASALPRLDLSFGVERTEFGRNNAQNSLWYRNAWFWGSWADDGLLLGHRLGGHGREWRAYVEGGSSAAGITLDASAYSRTRGDQNLFAPERQGQSAGGTIGVSARVNKSMRVILNGEIERGSEADSWTASRGRVGIRFGF